MNIGLRRKNCISYMLKIGFTRLYIDLQLLYKREKKKKDNLLENTIFIAGPNPTSLSF